MRIMALTTDTDIKGIDSQHIVLSKEKFKGRTVTCHGTQSYYLHIVIRFSELMLCHSDAQRKKFATMMSAGEENYFICYDFRFEIKPEFYSLTLTISSGFSLSSNPYYHFQYPPSSSILLP
jgi:hypothetical protein